MYVTDVHIGLSCSKLFQMWGVLGAYITFLVPDVALVLKMLSQAPLQLSNGLKIWYVNLNKSSLEAVSLLQL